MEAFDKGSYSSNVCVLITWIGDSYMKAPEPGPLAPASRLQLNRKPCQAKNLSFMGWREWLELVLGSQWVSLKEVSLE